jgi:hypothetical protein
MLKNLLLSKRMFLEGTNNADRPNSFSSGLAISLFQDSVEILVWALIKERNIQVKEGAGFVSNIEAIQKQDIKLNHIAKLYELNKARIGFKHYGNLPDQGEAGKFQLYVEEFLRDSCKQHFGINFDELSLADLISDPEISSLLKESEKLCLDDKFQESIEQAAKARSLIFTRLDKLLPSVDRGLREMDNELRRIPELGGSRAFQYLSNYLSALRETTLASLLRLPMKDFIYLTTHLPSAMRFGDGSWRILHKHQPPTAAETCQKVTSILIDLSIRLEAVL